MKIEVLGCSGAEFPGHYPSGFLVDGNMLFDAGTLNNVLGEKRQRKIENIFITHAHLDHIREIPFLADNGIIGSWKHRINIFSIPPVIKNIKGCLLNSKLWPDMAVLPNRQDAVLRLVPIAAGKPHRVSSYTILPCKVRHSVPAVGYLVEDQRKTRFFYTGDTGPTERTWRRLGEVPMHCLIIEVSFPNRMEEIAMTTGHLTPSLLEKELQKLKVMPERIRITHMKPQFSKIIKLELLRLGLRNLAVLRRGDVLTL